LRKKRITRKERSEQTEQYVEKEQDRSKQEGSEFDAITHCKCRGRPGRKKV
jgi:hypothetical protein